MHIFNSSSAKKSNFETSYFTPRFTWVVLALQLNYTFSNQWLQLLKLSNTLLCRTINTWSNTQLKKNLIFLHIAFILLVKITNNINIVLIIVWGAKCLRTIVCLTNHNQFFLKTFGHHINQSYQSLSKK